MFKKQQTAKKTTRQGELHRSFQMTHHRCHVFPCLYRTVCTCILICLDPYVLSACTAKASPPAAWMAAHVSSADALDP